MKWWYAVILRQNHVKSRRLHERTCEMTSGMKRRDHVISIYNFGSRKRYVRLIFPVPIYIHSRFYFSFMFMFTFAFPVQYNVLEESSMR